MSDKRKRPAPASPESITVQVEIPFAFFVDDYHEIDDKLEFFRNLFDEPRLRVKEVAFGPCHGCGRGLYWGAVYKGRCPGKKKLKEILAKAGWDKDSEISEIS